MTKTTRSTATKKQTKTGGAATSEPTSEAIALRAYELYLARAGGDGNEQDDWHQAERELSNGKSG